MSSFSYRTASSPEALQRRFETLKVEWRDSAQPPELKARGDTLLVKIRPDSVYLCTFNYRKLPSPDEPVYAVVRIGSDGDSTIVQGTIRGRGWVWLFYAVLATAGWVFSVAKYPHPGWAQPATGLTLFAVIMLLLHRMIAVPRTREAIESMHALIQRVITEAAEPNQSLKATPAEEKTRRH